jgi:hypothetical protein
VIKQDFEPQSISEEVWARLNKELTPEIESAAKAKPTSSLTAE